jgi:hypothetical protein
VQNRRGSGNGYDHLASLPREPDVCLGTHGQIGAARMGEARWVRAINGLAASPIANRFHLSKPVDPDQLVLAVSTPITRAGRSERA